MRHYFKNTFILFFVFACLPSLNQVFASCTRFYQKDLEKHSLEFFLSRDLTSGINYILTDSYRSSLLSPSQLSAQFPALNFNQILAILRIGFEEELFCNPVVLRLDQILHQLKNGIFTRSLERILEEKIIANRIMPGLGPDEVHPTSLGIRPGCPKLTPPLSGVQTYYSQIKSLVSQHLPTQLPDFVVLEDTQKGCFSSQWFYHLNPNDGKIYVKPNPFVQGPHYKYLRKGFIDLGESSIAKKGNRYEWNLHDDIGGPELEPGRRIVEVQSACENVIAIDDLGRAYFYQPTKKKELPAVWKPLMGQPLKGELHLPMSRIAWTFSCSLTEKEKRHTAHMHPRDIVRYYEDALGRKITFGHTSTIFVLMPDGTIRFWDSGLPPDFSRGFLQPNSGAFDGISISAAGSTIMTFGIDQDGLPAVYTRMYDYEINGACPGIQFSYEASECKIPANPNEVLGLTDSVRFLPLPGWRKHRLPNVQDPAFITDKINIVLTGQGNAAREMRFEGVNLKGQSGYYVKNINDGNWSFVITNQPLQGKRVFNHKSLNTPLPEDQRPKAKTFDFPLTQELAHLPSGASAELKKFHPFLGSDELATLTIHLKSGNKFDLGLYFLDSWQPFVQRPKHPEVVGQSFGDYKYLTATFKIPRPLLDLLKLDLSKVRLTPAQLEIRNTVNHYFAKHHHKHSTLRVLAKNDHMVMESIKVYRNSPKYLDFSFLRALKFEFKRSMTQNPFQDLIANPTLFLQLPTTAPVLLTLIHQNSQLLDQLQELKKQWLSEDLKSTALLVPLLGVSKVINVGASLLNVPAKDPYGAISKALPYLFKTPAKGILKSIKPKELNDSIDQLKDRIEYYESIYRSIK